MTLKRAVTPVLFCMALAPAHARPDCAPARAGISDLGYSAYREGEGYGGSTVDILRELQQRSGCKVELTWFPHSRLYNQFASGQLELTGASLRTAERDRHGVWLPYAYTQFELLLEKEYAGKFRSLADFIEHSHARLNVARGITFSAATQRQLDRLQHQGRLEYVNDYAAVFRKIAAGRAEGTLAPPTIHLRHQRQLGILGRMVAMPVSESPRAMVGMYVSKRVAAPVRKQYAEQLRAMISDGSVQRIYAHYLGEDISRQIFAGGVQELLDALPREP
ncbi:substrate-binding periplasmic protein [Pseudoduganella danionis]|uniref:Transporter substrate-binding domain-containing protein n=1 Tax=Pseudoduganella danionis TaxID=1890295 RepID=A0ABW9SQH7_9BURK|nr:ABC transporter substrate-binding protein [Pseudoduganella danionis]MTW34427.1 transporter substrate-binding domain-containing protein [Pseudoduganella danionis]